MNEVNGDVMYAVQVSLGTKSIVLEFTVTSQSSVFFEAADMMS